MIALRRRSCSKALNPQSIYRVEGVSEPSQKPSVLEVCEGYQNQPDCLIEILHAVQRDAGFLSDDDLKSIASALNISHADVHGVVSFYDNFRREQAGKKIVKICMAEACQAVGCEAIKTYAENSLSISMGETSADGEVTLKPVYCLGNCALGPAMMIDDEFYGRVTTERFESLIPGAGS